MASSDFLISLGVEFDVPEKELQNLTRDIEERIKRSSSIKVVDSKTIGKAKEAYKDLWKAAKIEAEKYLKAVESGNTKIMRQSLTDMRALQAEMSRLHSATGDNRGFKSSLTKYVKEEKQAFEELIITHQQLENQIERSATQQVKLEKQTQQYIETADKEIERISRVTYFLEKNAQAVDRIIQDYKKGNITYDEASQRLERLRTTHESLSQRVVTTENRVERLNKKFDESKRTTVETNSAYDNLENQLGSLRQAYDKTTTVIDDFDKSLSGGKGQWFHDFKTGLKSGLSEFSGIAIGAKVASEAIDILIQGIRLTVDEVKELNKYMTDIQMVAGTTNSETMKMFDDYNRLAKELSVTTKNVASGAGEWLRQGRSQTETMDLIKASTIQATLAQMDYEQSTTLLTSTLNGYKMEAQDAMHVVDALVQVDFAAATSVEELATSLQKTANTARTSGVDFERLVGYLGSVLETTRQAPELVGRAFRTMFSRMQGVAAGVEFDEEGESLEYTWGMVA